MRLRNIALSILLLTIFACELEDPLNPVRIDDIILLRALDSTLTTNGILANGIESTIIEVILDEESDPGQIVVFQVSEGTVTEPGMRSDGDSARMLTRQADFRTARIQVNALTTARESVVLTATISETDAILTFPFETAYPEELEIQPLPFSISAVDTIDVTVLAKIEGASVTDGILLDVSLVSSNSKNVALEGIPMLQNGMATFRLLPQDRIADVLNLSVSVDSAGVVIASDVIELIYN